MSLWLLMAENKFVFPAAHQQIIVNLSVSCSLCERWRPQAVSFLLIPPSLFLSSEKSGAEAPGSRSHTDCSSEGRADSFSLSAPTFTDYPTNTRFILLFNLVYLHEDT